MVLMNFLIQEVNIVDENETMAWREQIIIVWILSPNTANFTWDPVSLND